MVTKQRVTNEQAKRKQTCSVKSQEDKFKIVQKNF